MIVHVLFIASPSANYRNNSGASLALQKYGAQQLDSGDGIPVTNEPASKT